jgi:hypothetical protein
MNLVYWCNQLTHNEDSTDWGGKSSFLGIKKEKPTSTDLIQVCEGRLWENYREIDANAISRANAPA